MKNKFEKPLVLIIDGIDKAGKSTVCNLLSRKLDLPIIKMPNSSKYIKDGSIEKFASFYNELISQYTETSCIMDRGFPSSIAYSKHFLREGVDFDSIDRVLALLKPRVFILTVDDHVLMARKDDVYNVDDRIGIRDCYKKLTEVYTDYMLINTTKLTPLEVCNIILDDIEKWKTQP